MSIQLHNRPETHPVLSFRTYSSDKLKLSQTYPRDSLVTDQSFKDESDINTIMARYQSTGELPVINQAQANWLDVTGMDFQTHMDFIIEAQAMFEQLPSAVRDRFGNDPAAFLNFTNNPDNRVEIAKMGLLTPEATKAILQPPVENPASPPPAE